MTHTKIRAALAVGALVLAPLALVLPAQAADPAPTTVSITFDDTYADTIPALNAMQDRGIPGTLYVNSQRVGFSSTYLSRNQLKVYSQHGFEIGGHALNHEDLTTLTPDDARANICADRTNLINLGYRVTSFAYPFGANTPEVQQAAKDCGYNSTRGTSGVKAPDNCLSCTTAETIPPANPYYIRTPNTVGPRYSLDDIKGMVTQAENGNGGWVPLVFHHICLAGEECTDNGIFIDDFTALMDWIKARPASTVVKTVDQVIGGQVQPPTDGDDPVPESDLAIIGTRQHVIDGVNAKRTTDSMILYTRVSGTTTKTNAYGTEVAIVNGVVTKVENNVGSMAIPAGGTVLSGHGTSATWLKSYATVGTAIQIHNEGEPPPPPPPAPVPAPKTSVTLGSQNHAVSGVNVSRTANSLVVFTSEFGATTGTNQYGYEVAVVDGKVTKIEDSVGSMAIPANGFVLSGHGTSDTWLMANAKVGVTVINDAPPPPPPTPVPAPKTSVSIGSQSRAVTGVGVSRGTDALVVYTNTFGSATGTNAYGYEVAVVDGKVTKVEDRVGNITIPSNGYVLSGHGTSAAWLKANAVVGATVTPDGTLPPPPPTVVTPTTNVTIGSQSHAVAGVNVYRSANSLVVYTNANATTGANSYGYEVAVVDGKVTRVEDSVGNMAIPANGYVLSGHGTSDAWLMANAVVGATVTP